MLDSSEGRRVLETRLSRHWLEQEVEQEEVALQEQASVLSMALCRSR